ncbi:DUF7507 domain-containing protein [Actinoplanes flavus]|uniref:DUF7507 domain-containing protein n=1 Tax=Actinoplanes flavus TaxID=2820290 RepID=A0ABS3UYY9_9ACTN|nr:hypothetical protein [Actinoplanes flavus]MBO3743813.1 hypothetical protein [Actinoplanes flavus]
MGWREHTVPVCRRLGAASGATLLLAVTVAAGLVVRVTPAQAATGSRLFDESFRGASVADPGVLPLNDACLTGASSPSAPAGRSGLARCALTNRAPQTGTLPGYLQLTDTTNNRAGGIVYNRPLPASGGLVVTFTQYQYAGSAADGIAFFLTDGSTELTSVGAPGGSLGYAQQHGAPGVHGAYFGVGFDAHGNFVADNFGKGAGCASPSPFGRIPNTVTLRGPGEGTTGYCYVTSSTAGNASTLPASLRSASGPAAAARPVRITVSPGLRPTLTVEVDFNDGAGFRTVLSRTATRDAPSTYKFGFAASTGGATDVHLIRDMVINSVVPLGALSLTKQVDRSITQPASYGPGDRVPYEFVVVNTSVAQLTGVQVTDPGVSGITCPRTTLTAAGDPNSQMVCTGSHVITAAEALSPTYRNTATATADGGVSSGPSTVTVPITATPSLTLTKTAALADTSGDGLAQPGERIDYTFRVTNTGNVPLTGVGVTDPKTGTVTCAATTLAPGAPTTCTVAYTVTQADADTGVVHNSATARGTPPAGGAVVSAPATTDTPTPAPAVSLTLAKTAALVDGNANALADLGERIDYTFTVRNTGNVTLTAVAVTDPKTGTVACPVTTLAPAAQVRCTASYTVRDADVAADDVHNVATAAGTAPSGTVVTSVPAETRTPTPVYAPGIGLGKTATLTDANGNGLADTGETVTYTFTLTNTGNTGLTAVGVTDPKVGPVTCPATTLAPGAAVTCTRQYTVRQSDIDAGVLHNSATARGTPSSGPVTVSAPATTDTPTPARRPALALTKTATLTDTDGDGLADAGERIAYQFRVHNAGNVTLTSVAVSDPKVGPVTCPTAALPPGATAVCSAAYTVTVADVVADAVHNQATATASPPTGPAVSSQPATANVPTPVYAPSILIKKTATLTDTDGDAVADLGERIVYAFGVRNTGNAPLTGVQVIDTKVGTVTCPASTLAPNAQMICGSRTYTVVQADVDLDAAHNEATARGTPPAGPDVTSTASTDVPTPKNAAAIVLVKRPTLGDTDDNGLADVGERITFAFEVTNAGNTTLHAIKVTDPKLGTVTCPSTTLSPAAPNTMTCTAAPHVVTQADVDRVGAKARNTATVQALDPGNAPVSHTATAELQANHSSALALTKTATLRENATPNALADVGETIRYTFTVTNRGTVTIGNVTVDDSRLGTITCAASLAPGASATCTGDHLVISADIAAHEIHNSATAHGTDPFDGSDVVSPAVDANVATNTPVAGLALRKNGSLDSGGGPAGTITYRFTVTNTGTVTANGITVSDPVAGPVTCPPPAALLPGRSMTCTAAPYPVTQADVNAGVVRNTAHATATSVLPGTVTSNTATVDVDTAPRPSGLGLDKSGVLDDADGDGVADEGETVDYIYTVTNRGGTTLTGLTVDDPQAAPITCPPGPLPPATSRRCTARYTVTAADVLAGVVHNEATARANTPTGTTASHRAVHDILADIPPQGLVLSKKHVLGPPGPDAVAELADVGRTVDYTFVVTNNGEVTVTGVTVDDSRISVVDCPGGSLAPGATMTCTASYTVTQADVDAGAVHNEAFARGTPMAGPDIHSPLARHDIETVAATPSIDLAKTGDLRDANRTGVAEPGETVRYTYTVTNSGNVTLTGIALIDDPIGTVVCPATVLAPRAVVVCHATHRVGQRDIDAGAVYNTAVARGTAAAGRTVRSQPAQTTLPTTRAPAMTIAKEAHLVDANTDRLANTGERIRYTFRVTNTGNVTLTDVTVTDSRVRSVTCPAGRLAPGRSTVCAATYRVTDGDVAARKVVNVATATGTSPSGDQQQTNRSRAVTAATPGLPVTGAPATATALAALTLTALGLALTAAARQRRCTPHAVRQRPGSR